VLRDVAVSTESNEVSEAVVPLLAPADLVMNLEVFKRPALPTSPAVALQHSLHQAPANLLPELGCVAAAHNDRRWPEALEQRGAFSQRASPLVWSRTSAAIEPSLIALEGGPVNVTRMVLREENRPLLEGEMTRPFLDRSVFIEVARATSLAARVRASVHRIGDDAVGGGVGRGDPANLSLRPILESPPIQTQNDRPGTFE